MSALALPATASASADLARIVGPDGTTIAAAPAQAGYAFPADGSVAQVADVVDGSGALRLRGISLLGGRIRIDRAIVGRTSSVSRRVVVDGVAQPPGANRVVAVPGVGWALVLQRAVLPLPNGRQRETSVAVRLHLTAPLAGLPANSEVLIGLASGTRAGVNLAGAAAEIPPDLVPIYRAAARRYGVPWSVLAAINRVETSFGRNLSTSSAGAIGWMQFMPGTWAGYGVDANGDGVANPYDPVDAINAAASLPERQRRRHQPGGRRVPVQPLVELRRDGAPAGAGLRERVGDRAPHRRRGLRAGRRAGRSVPDRPVLARAALVAGGRTTGGRGVTATARRELPATGS